MEPTPTPAIDLHARHEAEFKRLVKVIAHGPEFQFLFAEAESPSLMAAKKAELDEVLHVAKRKTSALTLTIEGHQNVPSLVDEMQKLAAEGAYLIHLELEPGWLTEKMAGALNVFRDKIANDARSRLLFWLSPADLKMMAGTAIDLWSWRSSVVYFLSEPSKYL